MKGTKILLIETGTLKEENLGEELSAENYDLQISRNISDAQRKLKSNDFDIVMMDLDSLGRERARILDRVKNTASKTQVIAFGNGISTESAVSAMKEGVLDYILPPFQKEEISLTIERALEKAKLERERERYAENLDDKIKELQLLQKINTVLNNTMNLDEILEIIVDGITRILGYNAAGITLLNEDKTYFVVKKFYIDSVIVNKLEKLLRFSILGAAVPIKDGNLSQRVLEEKKPILTPDVMINIRDLALSRNMERLIKPVANLLGVRSGLIIPLLAEGEVIGTLAVGSQRQLTESDIERLTVFTGHASLAIQKAKLYNELLESREFLNNIIQSSVDGIIVTDMEMKIKMINRAMLSLLGYRESELIGRSVLELTPPRYRDNNELLNKFQELLSKEKIDYFEGEMVNKAGEEIPIGISLALMRNNEGQASGMVGTIHDLREMKRLERKLIQSERLAAVGGLAAGTAHEINNPLANIMIYAQMARRKLDDDSLIKSNLEVIEEQASMAKRIVSNLLKFSRQSNPILRKTDLNDSINSVLRLLRYSLEAKGIEVQTDLQEDLPCVEADPGQLEQVFTNIIVNAKDAMARNGGKLTVRTRYNDRANMIEVIFSDTGEGIPPENIPRLFDPFFTTKEVREGTGLGLSVSHGIIEDHKGTIEVESKVGVGSSFIVKLPALPQNREI